MFSFKCALFMNFSKWHKRLSFSSLNAKQRSFQTKILGWGDNSMGQLGLGEQQKVQLPTILTWSSTKMMNVKQIGCGEATSFLVSELGELYSCGDGERSQNGHSETMKHWKRVNFDFPVMQVSGGKNHTIFLTENGEVYSVGENPSGQLGYFQPSIQQRPKRIDALKGIKIVQITSGAHHNLAIDDRGEVYVWGNNIYGQAGLDHEETVWEPQHIRSLSDQKAIKVTAGISHSLILTSSGKLYGMGNNKQGQLGVGEKIRRCMQPTLIETFQLKQGEKIIDIVSGINHNLVLTDEGNLFGFGNNEYKQIETTSLLKTKQNVFLPVKILFSDIKSSIRMIGAGYFHSFVVIGDNELWAWGLGNDFQLGNGKQAITAPVKIDLTHFQQKRLIQLKSGWAHTIALVQEEEQHEQKKAHSSISNQ